MLALPNIEHNNGFGGKKAIAAPTLEAISALWKELFFLVENLDPLIVCKAG